MTTSSEQFDTATRRHELARRAWSMSPAMGDSGTGEGGGSASPVARLVDAIPTFHLDRLYRA